MTVPNLQKKHDFCAKNGIFDKKNKMQIKTNEDSNKKSAC
jgi:hypothetical protein